MSVQSEQKRPFSGPNECPSVSAEASKMNNAKCSFEYSIFPRIQERYPTCILVDDESDEENIVLRLPLQNKDDVEALKDNLSSIMSIEWVVYNTKQHFERMIFSKTWVCQHNSKNKCKAKKSKRDAACGAKLKIIIKKVTKDTIKKDKLLSRDPPLTGKVNICLKHTHNTEAAETLRMLRVTQEVKEAFFGYFSSGLGAAQAIQFHENKFLLEDDFAGLANAAINPTRRQVHYLHDIWREINLGSFINPLEMLREKLDLYNENGATVTISDNGKSWSVIVVTKVMQRLHTLQTSKEIIFIDSTCSCEATSITITVVLTATKVGALPLAVVIHPTQTEDGYFEAFSHLKSSFPFCFGGKDHAEIFMTDDSSAEKTALELVWPETHQLLCHFHVAQAEWRWLFSHSEEVKKEDKPRLMKLFQAVMYAKTAESLQEAVSLLLRERDSHPKFVKRFESFFQRKEEWVLLYRSNLITRQNNTNNYAEATMRILKDVVLCRTKAFNVVALVDFCITMWEPYLIKKLLEYAHSRRSSINILYEQFLKKTENFVAEEINVVAPNIFSIPSSSKNERYIINVDVGLCTCPSGISGGFCKHQFFLMKEKKLKLINAPPISPLEKYELAVIALGEKCPPRSFFLGFQESHGVDFNIEENENDLDTLGNGSTANFAANTRPFIEEHQKEISPKLRDEIKDEFIRLGNLVDGHVSQNSAQKLLRVLNQVRNINDFDKLFFFKSRKQGKIRVQPTSIARRRPGLTKSNSRVPSGRPPMSLKRRGIKRKRNLAENINENRLNAKSHGMNH